MLGWFVLARVLWWCPSGLVVLGLQGGGLVVFESLLDFPHGEWLQVADSD